MTRVADVFGDVLDQLKPDFGESSCGKDSYTTWAGLNCSHHVTELDLNTCCFSSETQTADNRLGSSFSAWVGLNPQTRDKLLQHRVRTILVSLLFITSHRNIVLTFLHWNKPKTSSVSCAGSCCQQQVVPLIFVTLIISLLLPSRSLNWFYSEVDLEPTSGWTTPLFHDLTSFFISPSHIISLTF